MTVRVTRQARADIDRVWDYIAEDNPAAADGVLAKIEAAFERLASFPDQGHPGRRERTRELVIAGTPYIIVYRRAGADTDILAVIHGARKWPT